MAHSLQDQVQRPHKYAIVDEVDSVLVDDARTPLIISGPVPKGDIHEFNELKPKISSVVQQQKQLLTKVLSKAKNLIYDGDIENGGFHLYKFIGAYQNSALIKFLSEDGIKQILQKIENFYMQQGNSQMLIFFCNR